MFTSQVRRNEGRSGGEEVGAEVNIQLNVVLYRKRDPTWSNLIQHFFENIIIWSRNVGSRKLMSLVYDPRRKDPYSSLRMAFTLVGVHCRGVLLGRGEWE